MLRSRVLQEALERLELHVAKVTSGVLRGRRVSNGSLLPGEEMDLGSPSARRKKEGDDVSIAVNVRYLMDALRAIDTQETLIGIDSELKPIVIRPSLHSTQGQTLGEHLCVLMPVRLSAG